MLFGLKNNGNPTDILCCFLQQNGKYTGCRLPNPNRGTIVLSFNRYYPKNIVLIM